MKRTRKLIAALIAFLLILPMMFLPTSAENGSGNAVAYSGKFTVVVDYYDEFIRIIPYTGVNILEVGTNLNKSDPNYYKDNVIQGTQFMYALKTTSDELLASYNAKKKLTSLNKDKWYPITGGEISIEKIIPKKPPASANKAYYIAIRAVNDNFTGESGYATRIAVPIKSRYYDKSLKKLLEYDADNQEYTVSSSSPFGGDEIMYSFDNFGYNIMQIDQSISVPSESYFNGGTLKVKTAPILNSDGVQYASSDIVKYAIPKAGTLPAVKIDSKKLALISLKKDKVEYNVKAIDNGNGKVPDPTAWQTYSGAATLLYTDLEAALGVKFSELAVVDAADKSPEAGIELTGKEYYYIIYFRTKAVSKKTPASPAKAIKMPYDEVNKALTAD